MGWPYSKQGGCIRKKPFVTFYLMSETGFCTDGVFRLRQKKNMNENKTSISKANSYQEIGEYWDRHDLGELWDKTQPASFEVDIQSECR